MASLSSGKSYATHAQPVPSPFVVWNNAPRGHRIGPLAYIFCEGEIDFIDRFVQGEQPSIWLLITPLSKIHKHLRYDIQQCLYKAGLPWWSWDVANARSKWTPIQHWNPEQYQMALALFDSDYLHVRFPSSVDAEAYARMRTCFGKPSTPL